MTTAGAIQQFPLSTPTATVTDMTAGPDGEVWFVQQMIDTNSTTTDSIGRITTSGTITMYPLSPNSTSAYITDGPGGNLWFTENSPRTAAIGQITAAGQTQTFTLPKRFKTGASLGNITVGSDGNLWFPISYVNHNASTYAIGKITAKGNVKLYNVLSTGKFIYPPPPPYDLISGPDGKLWYQELTEGKSKDAGTEIAQISTSGKLGSVIPIGFAASNVGTNSTRTW